MKLKKALLSLSLAGFCLSQASAQEIPHAGSAVDVAAHKAAAKHIGDGVKSIGDTNRVVDSGPDLRPAEFLPDQVEPGRPVRLAQAVDSHLLAPTACCPPASPASTWFSAETLLWFSDAQNAPALVTKSASGVFPTAGSPGVTSEFGDEDGIPTGLLPGYRIGGGIYLGEHQKIGIGGRVFGIYSDAERYSLFSDGSTSLGVPFFNADFNVNAEDAYLVAFTTPGGELVSFGRVDARADLDMIGADTSLRFLLSRSGDHRVDLLGGYTYNRLKSSVALSTRSNDQFTGNLIPNGTEFFTNDLFETDNTFHGAHLGVLSSVVKSRISFTSLAQISFGNVHQAGNVGGFTTETPPPGGGAPVTTPGGIFTQTSNIGTFENDEFAFLPEIGMKLGYQILDGVQFTVGYTFLYWSSVAVAGDQIDRTVDLTQVTARPAPRMVESGFWMQGLDLGLQIMY